MKSQMTPLCNKASRIRVLQTTPWRLQGFDDHFAKQFDNNS